MNSLPVHANEYFAENQIMTLFSRQNSQNRFGISCSKHAVSSRMFCQPRILPLECVTVCSVRHQSIISESITDQGLPFLLGIWHHTQVNCYRLRLPPTSLWTLPRPRSDIRMRRSRLTSRKRVSKIR